MSHVYSGPCPCGKPINHGGSCSKRSEDCRLANLEAVAEAARNAVREYYMCQDGDEESLMSLLDVALAELDKDAK